MELLDRNFQRELLAGLAERYPDLAEASNLHMDARDRKLLFNAMYLSEHGLINCTLAEYMTGPSQVESMRITHRGLDFLSQDGGLSAVLGVVTVKLDTDTLRALIEPRIQGSALPPEEKRKLIGWLRSAGQEGLAEAIRRLVGAALDQAPDALRLLQTLAG